MSTNVYVTTSPVIMYQVNYEYLNYSHNQIVDEFDDYDSALASYKQLIRDASTDDDDYAIDACYLERVVDDNYECLHSHVINQPD